MSDGNTGIDVVLDVLYKIVRIRLFPYSQNTIVSTLPREKKRLPLFRLPPSHQIRQSGRVRNRETLTLILQSPPISIISITLHEPRRTPRIRIESLNPILNRLLTNKELPAIFAIPYISSAINPLSFPPISLPRPSPLPPTIPRPSHPPPSSPATHSLPTSSRSSSYSQT